MKVHRFIGDFKLVKGELLLGDTAFVHQMRDVLRMKAGDELILCDGKGAEARATIGEIQKQTIMFHIESVSRPEREPDIHVKLYAPKLKSEHFEMAIENAGEAGVAEIIPLITERTVKLGLKTERLQAILREAAEQSGRTVLPVLRDTELFSNAVSHVEKNGENIFFDIDTPLFQKSKIAPARSISVWVGPEGGWSDYERDLARKAKFNFLSLGLLTLRAETAAIVGTYLATHLE